MRAEKTKAENTLSSENLRESDEKIRASILRSNPRNKNISGVIEF
jgi:hypothetical protein